MTRLQCGLLGAVLAGAAVLAVPPSTYAADDLLSASTRELCLNADVACSIQVDPVWIEGSTREVVVTGNPGVEVGVRAFRLQRSGQGDALTPLGPTASITTDARGFGAADLRLPTLEGDQTGGPILIALADSLVPDSAGTDVSTAVGTWSVLAARRPLVLGDGFANAKPVGQRLDLELSGVVPGTTFAVQIESGGQWRSIGVDAGSCAQAALPCSVGYEIPRGLTASKHAVRLVNESTGTPVASWSAVPSTEGRPADRLDVTDLPAVGAQVPGSITGESGATGNPVPRPRTESLDLPDEALHPAGSEEIRTARIVAVGFSTLALAVVFGGALRGSRRRIDLGARRG